MHIAHEDNNISGTKKPSYDFVQYNIYYNAACRHVTANSTGTRSRWIMNRIEINELFGLQWQRRLVVRYRYSPRNSIYHPSFSSDADEAAATASQATRGKQNCIMGFAQCMGNSKQGTILHFGCTSLRLYIPQLVAANSVWLDFGRQ